MGESTLSPKSRRVGGKKGIQKGENFDGWGNAFAAKARKFWLIGRNLRAETSDGGREAGMEEYN